MLGAFVADRGSAADHAVARTQAETALRQALQQHLPAATTAPSSDPTGLTDPQAGEDVSQRPPLPDAMATEPGGRYFEAYWDREYTVDGVSTDVRMQFDPDTGQTRWIPGKTWLEVSWIEPGPGRALESRPPDPSWPTTVAAGLDPALSRHASSARVSLGPGSALRADEVHIPERAGVAWAGEYDPVRILRYGRPRRAPRHAPRWCASPGPCGRPRPSGPLSAGRVSALRRRRPATPFTGLEPYRVGACRY